MNLRIGLAEVGLRCFIISDTYNGGYYSESDEEYNKRCIKEARERLESIHGAQRPTVIIAPNDPLRSRVLGSHREKLPGDAICIYLIGDETFHPGFHGSHLYVILFADFNDRVPLDEFLEKHLHHIDWARDAKGFYY